MNRPDIPAGNQKVKELHKKAAVEKEKIKVEEEPLAGYTLKNIFFLLRQNRFDIDRKYFWRFLYGIGVSLAFAPLRFIESITTWHTIRKTKVEKDPIFIIGYYRSGTTYLYTLLSKDKSKGYVSNVEGYLPTTFLRFPRLTYKMIEMSLPENRPMDNVIMTPEEPTEDEYSIGAFSPYSIYHGFVFPRNFKLYSRYNSFKDLPEDLGKWKKLFCWFTKKLTAHFKGNQIIYKNPSATYRIKHILDMYPNAKFIHIHRNPYEVFSSNVRYHNDVFKIYTLQKWDEEEMKQTILENYRELYECYEEQKGLIPKENLITIGYEDFLKAPMKYAEMIYKQLRIDGFAEAKETMEAYVATQKSYKPNLHRLGLDIIESVNENWGDILKRLGYKKLSPKDAAMESKVETPK